jgi:hypothetical protein
LPCSTWTHVKTGSTYTVLGIALCSTNGPDENKREDVVYVSHSYQGLRTREINEFLDGRFVPCPVETTTAANKHYRTFDPPGFLRADPPCDKAPQGWLCSREKGHEGPCAAHPDPREEPISVEKEDPIRKSTSVEEVINGRG